MRRTRLTMLVAAAAAVLLPSLGAESPYAPAIRHLEAMVGREIERGAVTGLSLALVDDQELVWAAGFGLADRRTGRRADADTAYRVGSISKLFTALGVMVLVERGTLDLDAPLTRHDPQFSIGRRAFPDAAPTTLRQLMSHCSGFPRESPVGSYFDGSEPTLEETVRSLAGCELVHRPETVTKYSNVGVALEGFVAARVAGMPFEEFQRRTLLEPLGMAASDFRVTDAVRPHLATGYMVLADGREVPAPLFELGTIPAGNLYAPVRDMARFLSFLFAGGRAGERRIVAAETLERMYEVQYAGTGRRGGFGLGFHAGELDGRRSVGHGGAVYGFSSQVLALPEEKLGVIACANDDVANGLTSAVARRALEWMLAAREGKEGPPLAEYVDLPAEELECFAGHFRAPGRTVRIFRRRGGLAAENMGQTIELRPAGDGRFLACGGGVYEAPLVFSASGEGGAAGDAASRDVVEFLGARLDRFDPLTVAEDAPAEWRDYLGWYGPWFIPTVVEIRHGRLSVLVENAFRYEMAPAGPDVFDFPRGLYEGEQLRFVRSQDGLVRRVRIGHVEFERQTGR